MVPVQRPCTVGSTALYCRFNGLVLSVQRPCTVSSAALYCQFSGFVLSVQRPCTRMTTIRILHDMAWTDAMYSLPWIYISASVRYVAVSVPVYEL